MFPSADQDAIIVRTSSPAAFDEIAAYAERHGYHAGQRSDSLSAILLDLDGADTAGAIATMLRAPGAVYVEPLYRAAATDLPADPLFAVRQRRYLDAEHAPEAWDIEQGDSSTIVAVVDTGVDATHPDLQGRLWVNPAEKPGNGIDDDGNDCVDDVHGCAFVAHADDPCDVRRNGAISDDNGHGTFIAGVIAANGNNGQGIVGVARGATVMAVKALDCTGSGNSLQVAQAILYAAQNGAKIINISLGGPSDPLIVRDAVRAATERYGALVVAAAGNTGTAGVTYPARYPEVLAVGAASIADPDRRAAFSTYGPEVDVAAIGEGIVGPVPAAACGRLLPCVAGGPYAVGSGTSFAAPQAAGLAALIASRTPGISPAQIIQAITSGADPVPPGDTPGWAGAGRINMLRALQPRFRLGAPGTAKD